MSVAHVLADDRSILALHQGVVVTVPRPRFGLLHQKLVEQLGADVVDELTAIVGMKPQEAEGKLPQHGLQHGSESRFADLWRGAHHLPLGDLVHRIDMIDSLHPVPISLVYRVYPQVSRPALGSWRPSLADGHRHGARALIDHPHFAVPRGLA